MEETIWSNYIGVKIIRATPMDETTFLRDFKATTAKEVNRPGYLVTYPQMNDEPPYQSWSPKDVFENAYRLLLDGEIRLVQEPH